MNFKKVYIQFFMVFAFCLAVSHSASALCGRFGDDQMDDFLEADIVVIGQASGVTKTSDHYASTTQGARFKIVEILKGNARGTITAYRFECSGHSFQEGGGYIIFAVKNKQGGYDVRQASPAAGESYNEQMESPKSAESKLSELRNISQFYKKVILANGDGQMQTHYDSGQVKVERNYKKGKLDGDYQVFFPNGQVKGRVHYVAGTKDGGSSWYYETGKEWYMCSYKEGYEDGVCKLFDQNTGQVVVERTFRGGEEMGVVYYKNTGKLEYRDVLNASGGYDRTYYDEKGSVTRTVSDYAKPQPKVKNR